jgi:hypothetical protein
LETNPSFEFKSAIDFIRMHLKEFKEFRKRYDEIMMKCPYPISEDYTIIPLSNEFEYFSNTHFQALLQAIEFIPPKEGEW